jgi:hypothetical protein
MAGEFSEITVKAPAVLLTAAQAQSGPPIAPLTRVMTYSPDEWEGFIDEWVSHCLKPDYVKVVRFSGANDRGIDVAEFADDDQLLGVWDNYQTPATEVRRKVVLDALHLMMTRDLITRRVDDDGIRFCAGEAAAMFLDSLRTPYLKGLKDRAGWLVHHLADYSDDEFDALMRRFFDMWMVEFQDIERSLGAAP